MSTKDAAKAIQDIFGGEPETSGVDVWLDTGYPPLNLAVSGKTDGGLPCGRIVQMYGDNSSGKTVVATAAMAAAQKQGGLALFMDHERSFMKHLAEQNGLDLTKGRFSLQMPRSFEESITKSIRWAHYIRDNEVIDPKAPLIVVFDSLAAMVPQQKLAKDADELKMNDSLALAKCCSSVFPSLVLHAEETNCLMLFLDQIRQDPGIMFGDNTKTSGGKAPAFYSTIRIALSRKVIKEDGVEKGQKIKAKVVKNKVSRPFLTCEWDFLFKEDGTGYLDRVGGMVDFLCEEGVLEKKGAYIEFKGKKYHRKPLVRMIEDNDLYDELVKLIPSSAKEV